MADFDDIDALYQNTPPDQPDIPPGEYFARVVGAEAAQVKSRTPGIRLRFRIEGGQFAGRTLREDYWLTPNAIGYSRKTLENIGFGSLKPSEIIAHRDFRNFPLLKALLETSEFEGRKRSEIRKVWRVPEPPNTSEGVSAA